MAEKAGAHPITKSDLEKHFTKVDGYLESIVIGTDIFNVYEELKGIGTTNKNLMSKEAQEMVEEVKKGLALYYQMYSLLEDRVKEANSGITEPEKKLFLGTYSMFAAGSYVENRLEEILKENPAMDLKKEEWKINEIKFDNTKDGLIREVVVRFRNFVNYFKNKKMGENPIDVIRWTEPFFQSIKEVALDKKTLFNPKLVELVKYSEFKIMDEYTISGFEASHEEKVKAKVEFAPILPHQIAGNVLAKQEMLRDMDRIALFDLKEQKNPIIDVGGLSWSVLYDGLPGTGKSSLFRMGLTRLKQRCEQVSEFWKGKNLGDLKWMQMIVDQGVKDEFYGKTGKNLLEKLNITKKPDAIYIITTDDIDLLVSGDRNSSSGGADKDILNILMQYSDGINTVIRGNVQWWAATNDATSMDPALRQRFIARYSVDGPQDWYDFSDILMDKLKVWVKNGIVQVENGKTYNPFKMRIGEKIGGGITDEDKSFLEKLKGKVKGQPTFEDIGMLCKEMKDKNPRFTGRAIHAVSEALKKRINDYEIPEEWYEKPETFFAQEYTTRVEMLKELCKPINGEIIIAELERYFESEERYANDRFESDVKKRVHDYQVEMETRRRLEEIKNGA